MSLRMIMDEIDFSLEKFYFLFFKMKENFLILISGEYYFKNWNKWKEGVNELLVIVLN